MSVRAVIYLRVSSAQQVEKDNTEEGYSIPAQREACLRFVEQNEWDLAGEYVDAGESARSVDRPQLQRMLSELKDDPTIRYVVVHKIDRMARNLEDHTAIRSLLKKAGAQLVSVTEGTGDTPSGRMIEGILATLAEYYSANLATEIKKGMHQKVKMGGWPMRTTIGYLNKRETVGGRSVASIIVDPDRGPLIAAGFELYSTGEIATAELARLMDERGLRTRGGNSLTAKRWQEILRNPFYMGRVVWNGDEYEGAHEPLVTPELFARVERVLELRNLAGTRERRHTHYLKGSLRCHECGALLTFSQSKGRSARYDYFFCTSRSRCSQPYVPKHLAEREVETLYRTIAMPRETARDLLDEVQQTIQRLEGTEEKERARLNRSLARLDRERDKLLQAMYADAIPVDLLKREQERISGEVVKIKRRLTSLDSMLETAGREIESAIRIASVAASRYGRYSPETRRKFNKAIFDAMYFADKKIVRYEYSEAIAPLMRTAGALADGSTTVDLVECGGFEPPTSAMRMRRSTS
jgi:site-specific DNA recombinase